MLLQAGARPLLTDLEGKTAIDYAESAQFPDVIGELRDAAKLMPQPASPMPSMASPFRDAPVTPRMTPRVPGSQEVRAVMTPRVPRSASGGDMTARRLMAESPGANGASPKSPSITKQQLTPLSTEKLSQLAKKLVHLSVMLEQDTVLSDTAYPTFHLPQR